MPGLTFVHPIMLWGLLAGAIPIIIHLLNRRRYRPMPWAAMRFLREAIRINARRIQIEDLILLALRCLALMLAALAFTLPVLRGKTIFLGRQPSVCTVILLDDSYSMNYVDGETSRFERGRTAARDLIARLKRGDSVSVILMSDRPRRLFRDPTFDLDLGRHLLGRLERSYSASGAERALAMAREDVEKARQPAKTVCLISDFQKDLLAGSACQALLAAIKEKADLIAIPIGEGYDSNLAVVGLEAETGVVAVGVPTTVHVRIHNYGQAVQQDYPVELFLDGRRSDRRWVTVAPGSEVDVTFSVEFRDPGQHALEARLPADLLPTDNSRYRVVDVRSKVPILLVSGETPGQGAVGATEYIGAALAPGWLIGESEEDHLWPERVSPALFRPNELNRYPMVFLTNVPSLDASQVAGLEQYVRDGGGLMIVPGDRIDVGFYNDALFRSGRGLMPARIVAPGFRTEQGECFLSPTAGDHPVLSVFADRSHGDLSQVRFKRTLLLDPPASTATAVCAFSTGRPAIVEKAFGKGRVMLMAAGLGRDWADFVWKPTFLVFIRRATDYLMRRESESLNLSVYETATRFEPSASAATKLTVATPGGEMDQPIAESAVGGMRIQYGAISRPGIYRLMADQQPLGQFAANVDVRESDIGLPPMGLAGTPIRRVGVADVASVREPSQSGAELWMFCLKAALAVMILEALFLLAIEWRQKQAGKAGRRSA